MQNISALGDNSGSLLGNIVMGNAYINITNGGKIFSSVKNINISDLSKRTSVFMKDRMTNEIYSVFKFAKKAAFFAYCHPIIMLSTAAFFYVVSQPCVSDFLITKISDIISFCVLYLMNLKLACDIKDCVILSVLFFVVKYLQYKIDCDANIDIKNIGSSDSLFFKILTAVGDVYKFLSSELKVGTVLASAVNKLCNTVANEVENAFVLCVGRCIIDLVMIKFMPTIIKCCISSLPFFTKKSNDEARKQNDALESSGKDSADTIKSKVVSESMTK